MKYLKYTPYIYLLAGLFFLYKGFDEMDEVGANPALSFIIAGLAIAMFLFRRHYAKKFERYRKDKP
jgi:hypothetical protein